MKDYGLTSNASERSEFRVESLGVRRRARFLEERRACRSVASIGACIGVTATTSTKKNGSEADACGRRSRKVHMAVRNIVYVVMGA